MQRFCQLLEFLDQADHESAKTAALQVYFRGAPSADAAWALYFLSGRRLKRSVDKESLKQWAAEGAGLPLWLVEECEEAAGDLAEALALLIPPPEVPGSFALASLVEEWLLPLARVAPPAQKERVLASWRQLGVAERLLWHRLLLGVSRAGVEQVLLSRSLAAITGLELPVIANRLVGDWKPTPEGWHNLLVRRFDESEPARPYPFCLASSIEAQSPDLGPVSDWTVEWKWDGIRVQILRRAGECVMWSRGQEVITPCFPEIESAARLLPDGVVLDGEILALQEDRPLPLSQLQRRLDRQQSGARLQREVPVVYMAYDLLERQGLDCRQSPLEERRVALAELIAEGSSRPSPSSKQARSGWQQDELFPTSPADQPIPNASPLRVSPSLEVSSWEALESLRQQARAFGACGLVLKRRSSFYEAGRAEGVWWNWKVVPFTCDAVLVGAQPGQGRRSMLFTDYTFAVWRGDSLVTVARARSGLSEAEIEEIDAFVRANTVGKFGPMRSVKPDLVFELSFDGVEPSSRHKSGVALRSPRIARWRREKPAAEADTLVILQRLVTS